MYICIYLYIQTSTYIYTYVYPRIHLLTHSGEAAIKQSSFSMSSSSSKRKHERFMDKLHAELKLARLGQIVRCLVLQYILLHTATHKNTLQHAATHDNTLQHAAIRCNALQHCATLCNIVQHSATQCNTVQHSATHCNALQRTATHCNTLQHTATHCNELQHTATHCNTLQHTVLRCNTLMLQATDDPERSHKEDCAHIYNTMQYIATHCDTLHHIFKTLQHILQHLLQLTATHCRCSLKASDDPERLQLCMQRAVAHCNTHCNSLQHAATHTATHCNSLELAATATHCKSLQMLSESQRRLNVRSQRKPWSVCHDTATYCNICCNTLQHIATHCNNTLQHTVTHCRCSLRASDDSERGHEGDLAAFAVTLRELVLRSCHVRTCEYQDAAGIYIFVRMFVRMYVCMYVRDTARTGVLQLHVRTCEYQDAAGICIYVRTTYAYTYVYMHICTG